MNEAIITIIETDLDFRNTAVTTKVYRVEYEGTAKLIEDEGQSYENSDSPKWLSLEFSGRLVSVEQLRT